MLKSRLAWAFAFVLVLVATAAQAQSPVLNVQVINVCDDNGNNCALSSPYAGYAYNPIITQRIFDQAGVTVNLLAPVNFNNSAYLNPAIIDDPAHGYTTGSPTDPAHQLINLPGHYQSTVPNVLDMWFVNSLPHLQADGSAASSLFGLGLLNANGAIVTTGDNGSGYIAGPDNIAHELGHNLGLTHTDGPPLQGLTIEAGSALTQPAPPGTYPDPVYIDATNNLMDGSSRLVPLNPCAVASPTCAGVNPPAGKDLLFPFQIDDIQRSVANLFTVSGLTATAVLEADSTGVICTPGATDCTIKVSVTGDPNSTDTLHILKVRFTYPLPATTLVALGQALGACGTSAPPVALPGGGSEIDITFVPGCFGPGTTDDVTLLNAVFQGGPFSFEFDFTNGLTSLAAFDSSGTANSSVPIALSTAGANPTGPGLPLPNNPVDFNFKNIIEPVSTVSIADIPEPASALLFVIGVVLVGLLAPRTRVR